MTYDPARLAKKRAAYIQSTGAIPDPSRDPLGAPTEPAPTSRPVPGLTIQTAHEPAAAPGVAEAALTAPPPAAGPPAAPAAPGGPELPPPGQGPGFSQITSAQPRFRGLMHPVERQGTPERFQPAAPTPQPGPRTPGAAQKPEFPERGDALLKTPRQSMIPQRLREFMTGSLTPGAIGAVRMMADAWKSGGLNDLAPEDKRTVVSIIQKGRSSGILPMPGTRDVVEDYPGRQTDQGMASNLAERAAIPFAESLAFGAEQFPALLRIAARMSPGTGAGGAALLAAEAIDAGVPRRAFARGLQRIGQEAGQYRPGSVLQRATAGAGELGAELEQTPASEMIRRYGPAEPGTSGETTSEAITEALAREAGGLAGFRYSPAAEALGGLAARAAPAGMTVPAIAARSALTGAAFAAPDAAALAEKMMSGGRVTKEELEGLTWNTGVGAVFVLAGHYGHVRELVKVMNDPAADWRLRAEARKALGQIGQVGAQIDVSPRPILNRLAPSGPFGEMEPRKPAPGGALNLAGGEGGVITEALQDIAHEGMQGKENVLQKRIDAIRSGQSELGWDDVSAGMTPAQFLSNLRKLPDWALRRLAMETSGQQGAQSPHLKLIMEEVRRRGGAQAISKPFAEGPEATGAQPSVPEKQETLRAQIDAMQRGQKPAVLIPPGAETPTYSHSRFKAVMTDRGKIIAPKDFDFDSVKREGMTDAELAQILGYAAPRPAPGEPAVTVTGRTAGGAEAETQVVPPAAAPAAAAQTGAVAGPGGTVETGGGEQAGKIIDERRQTEREPGAGGASGAYVLQREDGSLGVGGAVDAEFNRRRGGKTIAEYDEGNFEDSIRKAQEHATRLQEEQQRGKPAPPNAAWEEVDASSLPAASQRKVAHEAGVAVDERGVLRVPKDQAEKVRDAVNEEAVAVAMGEGASEKDYPEPPKPGETPKAKALRVGAEGSETKVKTASGDVPVRYAVVDLNSLTASFDKGYPQELQPRDRSRVASDLQIDEIARNLDPERLGENVEASLGAPVVSPEGHVESGNGRVAALRRAVSDHPEKYDAYYDWLHANARRFGIDPEAINAGSMPVLVRIRQGEMTPEARRRFVEEANQGTIAAMSAPERAAQDAGRMDDKIMELFQPGEDGNLTAASNRGFLRAFVERVASGSDRGTMLTDKGELSQEGLTRVRNAVLAKAYGTDEIMRKLSEDLDTNIKSVANGFLNGAAAWAKARDGMTRGELFGQLDITDDLLKAARKLSELRDAGTSVRDYIAQQQMFADEPIMKTLVEAFGDPTFLGGSKRARYVSAERIGALIREYANMVEGAGSPKQNDMFGREVIKEDALVAAIKKVRSQYGEGPTLFGEGGSEEGPGTPPPGAGAGAGKKAGEGKPAGGAAGTAPKPEGGKPGVETAAPPAGEQPKPPEPTATTETEAKPAEGAGFGSSNTLVNRQAMEEALKRLNKKLQGPKMGLPVDAIKDAVVVGTFYVEGGVRKASEWSRQMLDALGEGAEAIKPYLKAIWGRIQKDLEKSNPELAKMMEDDYFAPVKKEGPGETAQPPVTPKPEAGPGTTEGPPAGGPGPETTGGPGRSEPAGPGTTRGDTDVPGSEATAAQGGVPGAAEASGFRRPEVLTSRQPHTKRVGIREIPNRLKDKLFDHQRQAVAAAMDVMDLPRDDFTNSFILASSPGTGKTSVIASVADMFAKGESTHGRTAAGEKKKYSVLIVAPTEILNIDPKTGMPTGSYKEDFERLGVKYSMYKGGEVQPGGIYMVGYNDFNPETVKDHTVLIFDESHALKNEETARSQAGIDAMMRAHSVMFSTATPVDKPQHIYYLARAGVFEGKDPSQQYRDLGLIQRKERVKGPGGRRIRRKVWVVDPQVGQKEVERRLEALFERMTGKGRVIRHELSFKGLTVGIDPIRMNDEMKQTAQRIVDGILQTPPGTGRLSQAKGLELANILMSIRRQQEPYKVDKTVDIVKRELAEGRQVVVFLSRHSPSRVKRDIMTWSQEEGRLVKTGEEVFAESEGTAKLLREALHKSGIMDVVEMHGGKGATPAEKAIPMFQDSSKRVFITTIEKGSMGINLDDRTGQAPRTVVFMTAPFDAMNNFQAANRVHRLTTASPSRIQYVVSDHPIDMWNTAIIAKKMGILGAATPGEIDKMKVDFENIDFGDYEDQGGDLHSGGRGGGMAMRAPAERPAENLGARGFNRLKPSTWGAAAKPEPGDVPEIKSVNDLIDELSKKIDRAIEQGRVRRGSNVAGYYTPSGHPTGSQFIALQKGANRLYVVMHELGHHFQSLIYGGTAYDYGKVMAKETADLGRRLGMSRAALRGEIFELLKDYGRGPQDAKEKASEAYAQFVRLLITDPAEAKRRAPKLSEAWEEKIQRDHPELQSIVDWARDEWNIQKSSPLRAQNRSTIKYGEKNRYAFDWDEAYRLIVDDMWPIKKAFNEMAGDTPIRPDRDARILADTFRGYVGLARNWLESGPFEFNTPGILRGKSLKAIVDPLRPAGFTVRDFDEYSIAARGKYLADTRGGGTEKWIGWTPDRVKATLDYFEQHPQAQVMKTAYEEYNKFMRKHLTYFRDAGYLSQEGYKKIVDNNELYTTLLRVVDTVSGTRRSGSKLANLWGDIKAIFGSERDIRSPIESAIKMVFSMHNKVERNEVAKALYFMIKGHPEGARWGVAQPMPMRPVDVNVAEVLQKLGIKPEELPPEFQSIADEVVQLWKPDTSPPPPNTVWVWIGGKRHMIRFNDERLYKTVLQMEKEPTNMLVRFLAPLMRFGRASILLDPTFMARNFSRDQLTAMVRSEGPYKVRQFPNNFATALFGGDLARGVIESIGGDKLLAKYNNMSVEAVRDLRNKMGRAGTSMTHFFDMSPEQAQNYIKRHIEGMPDNSIAPVAWLRRAIEMAEEIGTAVETATRLQEARLQGLEEAKTRAEMLKAGIAARRVTVDFGRAGVLSRWLNQTNLFFNPSVQGWATTFEILGNKRTAPVAWMRMMNYLIVPTTLAYLYNYNDERYWQTPAQIRNSHWVFYLPGREDAFRFPFPHELAAPATAWLAVLEYAQRNDPKAFTNWAESLIQQLPPALPFLFSPVIESAFDWKFFGSRPLESQGLRQEVPEERVRPTTSYIARGAARAMSYGGELVPEMLRDPIRVENLMQEYAPGLGKFVLEGADYAAGKLGLVPERSRDTAIRLPGLRGFTFDPEFNTEAIQRMYDMYDTSSKAASSQSKAYRTGNMTKAQRIASGYAEPLQQNDQLRQAVDTVNGLRKASLRAEDDPNLSPEEKRKIRSDNAKAANEVAESAIGYGAGSRWGRRPTPAGQGPTRLQEIIRRRGKP